MMILIIKADGDDNDENDNGNDDSDVDDDDENDEEEEEEEGGRQTDRHHRTTRGTDRPHGAVGDDAGNVDGLTSGVDDVLSADRCHVHSHHVRAVPRLC